MKRLLSVVLALSMVLTLIPAFASAEDSTNDVIIDFDECTAKSPAVPPEGAPFSFNHMGLGTIEWRRDMPTTGETLRVTLASSRLWLADATSRIAAIDVEIPANGYYSIKFRGGLSRFSGNTTVFMDSTCTNNRYYSGGTYVGDYDFTTTDESTSSKNAIDGEEKTLNTVYLTAGKHTIMFLMHSTDSTTSETYLFFKKLSFIYKGEEAPTVESLEATVPAQTIGVGETYALSVDAKMSDESILYLAKYTSAGEEDNTYEVKVTSDNEDAVKVTSVTKGAEGNAEHTASYSIKAVGEGNATLTYTLCQNSAEVKTITKEVTVSNKGINDVICDFDTIVSKGLDGNQTVLTEAAFKEKGFPFSLNLNGLSDMGWTTVTTGDVLRATVSSTKLWPNEGAKRSAIFNVDIPADGYYSVKFQGGKSNVGAKTAIFIDSVYGTYFSDGTYLGDYDFITEDTAANANNSIRGEEKTLNTVYLTKGSHQVVFLHSESPVVDSSVYLFFHKLSFIYEGSEKLTAETVTSKLPSAMNIGDKADLEASVTMSDGTPLYMSEYRSSTKLISKVDNPDTANRLDVTSENSDIVKVTSVTKGGLCNSENTNYSVEAVAGGTTNLVYTLYRDGEKPVTWKRAITVNEKKVKLMADKNGDGKVNGDELSDVIIGKPVSVTAADKEGCEFAYWTDADGGFVSELATYSFTPYTNTVLLAVYRNTDEVAEEKIGVEFFDGNRDYLGFVEAESGTAFGALEKPAPSLIGYQFLNWSISDETAIDGLLSAVAMYEEDGSAITGDVTINGETIQTPAYGAKIEKTISGAKAWKRTIGGTEVTVAYGDSYDYYVWDDTTITAITTNTTAAPLVVLDDPAHGAYMIEYDNGGVTALEAGILFGSANSTVDSCYAKAKTKEIKPHGQFTAKPAAESSESLQTHVRGYLIYKDAKGVVKTIYTAAVEIAD